MNKLILPPNTELRVELIRLYPDAEAHATLRVLQDEVRNITNHIVRGREDVKNARKACAKREQLVGDAPVMPEPPNPPTPTTDEEKLAVKELWREHKRACKDVLASGVWMKYYKQIDAAVKGRPELDWRKDSYQDLRSIYGRLGNAVLYRDTVKRVMRTKRANYKRRNDPAPLVWGNAPLVETGGFYGERRGAPWYNARIKVNGMVLLGRLRRPIPGKQVQGVTLNLRADGWYAAVKCIVPARKLTTPVSPGVGLDVGQTDLVALSDGYTKKNDRTALARTARAALQSVADLSRCPEQIVGARRKIARIDQADKRRVVHWLHSELLPRLELHEFVAVEKLAKNFKSNTGGLSYMHATLDVIKLRLGDRVREVDCAYTSQTCSHCGNVAKEARNGKLYTCVAPGCGHVEDADINAARNILHKASISLAA
jgi:hypothetical protein